MAESELFDRAFKRDGMSWALSTLTRTSLTPTSS